MRNGNRLLLVCVLIYTHTLFYSLTAKASTDISLFGWTLPPINLHKPDPWLGQDPVLGRLICPPITRYNPIKGTADSPFFYKVQTEQSNNQTLWKLSMYQGIYWWNGDQIEPREIKAFINETLHEVFSHFPIKTPVIPSFSMSVEDYTILIHWASTPPFGPFILNGFPLYKTQSLSSDHPFQYMCAGTYTPLSLEAHKIVLRPNAKYNLSKNNITFYFDDSFEEEPNSPKPSEKIHFRHPHEYTLNSSDINYPSCSGLVNTPWQTAIIWQANASTKSTKLRKMLGSILPRQYLLEHATFGWSEIQADLILWNRALEPTDPNRSQLNLMSIADFRQEMLQEKFRFDSTRNQFISKDDVPFKVRLLSTVPLHQKTILEKVIEDTYRVAGIDFAFSEAGHGIQGADGQLVSLLLPQTALQLLQFINSSELGVLRQSPAPIVDQLNQQVWAFISSYSLPRPDFSLLKDLQNTIFDLEVFTAIAHHKSCVQKNSMDVALNSLDPDWIKRLIQ